MNKQKTSRKVQEKTKIQKENEKEKKQKRRIGRKRNGSIYQMTRRGHKRRKN